MLRRESNADVMVGKLPLLSGLLKSADHDSSYAGHPGVAGLGLWGGAKRVKVDLGGWEGLTLLCRKRDWPSKDGAWGDQGQEEL